MILLLVSIAALFAGVLAFPLAARKNHLLSVLDGFVVFSVGGLVVFHLFPHSFNEAGFGAIAAAAVGLTFPLLIERWSTRRNDGEGNMLLVVLALTGLAIHAFMDGNALVLAGIEEHGEVHDHEFKYEHGFTLALASLFHRLPIGLVIGNLLARGGSLRRPLAVATMMAATTCAGFFVGESVIPLASHYAVSLFQAFVAGNAMTDHVIDRGADGTGKAPVIQRRGNGILLLGDIGMANLVQFAGGHPRPDFGRDHAQHFGRQLPGDPHLLNFVF